MKQKLLVKAPCLTRSGYGLHSRFLLKALRQREDQLDIFIIPTAWGKCGWVWEDSEFRNWIDQTIQKTAIHVHNGGQFDISVQVDIPNSFQKMAPVNIGVTAGIETTKIARNWVEKINIMDKIITVSDFSKTIMQHTKYDVQNPQTGEIIKGYGVTTPIEVVHFPVPTAKATTAANPPIVSISSPLFIILFWYSKFSIVQLLKVQIQPKRKTQQRMP